MAVSQPPGAEWRPTHRVVGAAAAAWDAPDPARPSTRTLAVDTVVQVTEEANGWARVVLPHGRVSWVAVTGLEGLTFDTRPPNAVLDLITGPGKDMLALLAVFAVTLAITYVLRPVLAFPGNVLKGLIPRGNCSNKVAGTTTMYLCSVKVGFLTALGPVIVMITGLVFRRPLMQQVQKLMKRLPRKSSMFVTPAIAASMFTMVYGSIHAKTLGTNGLVPQRMFPAVLGLLTFLAARLKASVAKRFGGAIERRDRIPAPVRMVFAFAFPMLVAYVIMKQDRVTDTATKEQFVALLTVFTSYASFVPRDGDFIGAARRLLVGRGRSKLMAKVPGRRYIPPGVVPPV